MSTTSRQAPQLGKLKFAESYATRPPETIILKIPELEDSPDLEDLDYISAKSKLKKLNVADNVRRSQSAIKGRGSVQMVL